MLAEQLAQTRDIQATVCPLREHAPFAAAGWADGLGDFDRADMARTLAAEGHARAEQGLGGRIDQIDVELGNLDDAEAAYRR